LLGELSSVKAVFAGNEAEIKLPETREFFWSKIQRQIERENAVEPTPVRVASWASWLQRHLLQVSGAAFLACMVGVLAMHSTASAGQFGEMELASDQIGAYTFRDQQEGMTMVWFYNHNDDSQFTEDPSVASMETE